MRLSSWSFPIPPLAALLCSACPAPTAGTDGGVQDGGGAMPPAQYAFASREGSANSVAYDGQVARALLLEHLKEFMGSLQDEDHAGSSVDTVRGSLQFYYDFKNMGGAESDTWMLPWSANTPTLQARYGDIGGLVSLQEKVAGVDNPFAGGVVGAPDPTQTPDEVVQAWFTELAELVVTRAVNGQIPQDPFGRDITKPFVTADGRDLQQLIQKFLQGAVAYSQAADDYLDDDTAGKGLLSSHAALVEGKPYTDLEHAWDEGFGYFGAARDLGDYTDEETAGIAGREPYRFGVHDSDQDGAIDLKSEWNHSYAVHAAKRALGSSADVAAPDLRRQIFDAFLAGRHLIASASTDLTPDQLDTLRGHRDVLLSAWEKTIAASVVHCLNQVLQDMAHFDTPCSSVPNDACYDFATHAKHFSEMKGFALTLQFNPRATLRGATYTELHDLLGDAPALPQHAPDQITAYQEHLVEARSMLMSAFDFQFAAPHDDMSPAGL